MTRMLLIPIVVLTMGGAWAQPTFPRVDARTQAARDNDRSAILVQERDEETKALQVAENALASGAFADKNNLALDVERHRKNLAALNAEIQRVRGAIPVAVKTAGPIRLRAASTTPAAPVIEAPVPFWDVYRRKETQP